ncbi:LON peptidase substrate-binding domain-containing protein [Pseudomonas sp. EpS/L25]|uniref:LON peptidase substrate-binding domain-containing protein n=1 Tax=Pseudomonas sp. EpS/L25 TaxID=1749078 RepID=UPI00074388F8|nr:LON peptidase substrate-binding domain-containing protein [Pseudomonas sp. EpS/L25]KUM41387.1 ATP-dependent protease [Pseudomonas sp. EpS/L25]
MSLPLFPLNTTLFPGCRLDLQLFEARYLDMLGRCLKQGTGFGVVTILDGRETGAAPDRLGTYGCEALIRDWQQQSNGLLGIRVEGGRRFRLLSQEEQADHLVVGEVEWLPEAAPQPVRDADGDLLALLVALAQHPMVAGLDMGGEVADRQALGCQLAYLLPFEPRLKLAWLGLDDQGQRLADIERHLVDLQGDFQA